MMADNRLFASIGSLVHELRGSATYILGVYEVLEHQMPVAAQELWNDLGRISERVLIDIEDHMGNILANIDSYSAATASARIDALASGWERDAAELALISDQISNLHIQLEDPKLNLVLNEYLPSGIRGFGRIVSFARQIRPEDL
jgi:hypothetical protein